MKPYFKNRKCLFCRRVFWCMEPVFDVIDGVVDTTVGYMGGGENTANYKDVSSGNTNHYEAIKVTYDPNKVSYKNIIRRFWRSIDPTDAYGQFADKGPHYQTAIFEARIRSQIIDASIKRLLKRKII